MKEMRPVVQAEFPLKELAAINQILGRRSHDLLHEEQAKYYEKAPRQKHMETLRIWALNLTQFVLYEPNFLLK